MEDRIEKKGIIEVGMPIGQAVGEQCAYVSGDPASPMACAVCRELGAQGVRVSLEGPGDESTRPAFNTACVDMGTSPCATRPQTSPRAAPQARAPSCDR